MCPARRLLDPSTLLRLQQVHVARNDDDSAADANYVALDVDPVAYGRRGEIDDGEGLGYAEEGPGRCGLEVGEV